MTEVHGLFRPHMGDGAHLKIDVSCDMSVMVLSLQPPSACINNRLQKEVSLTT